MNRLTLRTFLATTVSCAALWVLYELAWIPYAYDLESGRIERRLGVHLDELSTRFAGVPPERWSEETALVNRESEDHHTLVRQGDPDWLDLLSQIRTEGTRGQFASGADAMGILLLPGETAMLRVDQLGFEETEQFDGVFWGSVAAALLLGYALLTWVMGDHRRRIGALSGDIERVTGLAADPARTDGRTDELAALEAHVHGLIGHLEDTTGDLTESLASQRDLLHAVAHEFRGPIARLRFAADLAEEAEDARERARLLGNIDEAVQELEDLVTEVLGYSRIRHGGYRLQVSTVDLTELTSRVLDKARGEYPGVVFHAVDHLASPLIDADPRMLERALINVVRNAGRFARGTVEVICDVNGDGVLVAVGDDGNGIAPGKRERIFEPFTRLDASRSRDSGGSGLGLAIAQAIAHQHGGTIQCGESRLGGAEFQLHWPRAPHDAVAPS